MTALRLRKNTTKLFVPIKRKPAREKLPRSERRAHRARHQAKHHGTGFTRMGYCGSERLIESYVTFPDDDHVQSLHPTKGFRVTRLGHGAVNLKKANVAQRLLAFFKMGAKV